MGKTYLISTSVAFVLTASLFALQSSAQNAPTSSANYTLTVSLFGNGSGTVTSSDGKLACTQSPLTASSTGCTTTYTPGSQVNLVAAPTVGSHFDGWHTVGCADNSLSCSVTMDDAQTISSSFTFDTLFLDTVGGSGSITATVNGVTNTSGCAPSGCHWFYPAGTTITLSVVPDSGYTVDHWDGCTASSAALASCTVTPVGGYTYVYLYFKTSSNQVSLNIARISGPEAGTVTSSPIGINCGDTCSANFAPGTTVTLTANSPEGYAFSGWRGCSSESAPTCTVTVNTYTTVSVSFFPKGIISPQGGEQWTPGQTYTVIWSTAGLSSASLAIHPQLDVLDSTNSSVYSIQSPNTAVNADDSRFGHMTLTVPMSLNGDYKIQVSFAPLSGGSATLFHWISNPIHVVASVTPINSPTSTSGPGATSQPALNNQSGGAGATSQPASLQDISTDAQAVATNSVDQVTAVTQSQAADLLQRAQYIISKIQALQAELATITPQLKDFIALGTPTTQKLGQGERAGVVSSFTSALGKAPESATDWQDVIKIANGRWPTQRNSASEQQAAATFKHIYLRAPDTTNAHDNAAVTVMAYGLRPANRNLGSEVAAIKSFTAIYGHAPSSASDWDAVRAIAYSGATR